MYDVNITSICASVVGDRKETATVGDHPKTSEVQRFNSHAGPGLCVC